MSQDTKTKSFLICDLGELVAGGTIIYGQDNSPKDTIYRLQGFDSRYQHLRSALTLRYGTLEDLLYFSKKIVESMEEDDMVTLTFGSSKLTRFNNGIAVYGIGNDYQGYTFVSRKTSVKLMEKIEEYTLRVGQ